MATKKWDSIELTAKHGDLIRSLRADGLGHRGIAEKITLKTRRECTRGVIQVALQKLGDPKSFGKNSLPVEDVSSVHPSDGEQPISEIISQRIASSKRNYLKASAHKRTLELPAEPIGIMVFGDPHVDNEGCDWGTLFEHVKLARDTKGVLAACVGDMQDNWVGRLQKLYAKSTMEASDAWRLSQWLLESMQWIALCGGNHDQWSHAPGVDPLAWISKQAEVMCYADDEIRITMTWRGRPDLAPLIWILRHDFSGRSWYHPTHGPNKEAMLDGQCHLLTAGHIHQWGELTTEQRHERVTHAIRVRGYKRNDDYARAHGFAEQQHGEAALIIIDPTAAEPGRIKIHWDLAQGCDYLTWLRARAGC